ncbi:YgjV family protein [Glaciibacter psychrotolerans]|uniref:YgjV family protein n=1 Tax=Glaciibacter psychrotolerans TaxID=670054 RepID=A0A7Z0ECU0_9MICO|nr:YgjV family protein [Leifsonia psychrotolerans]NYJ18572.1 hypothetical protein [Leifsonia psychrotolerans]
MNGDMLWAVFGWIGSALVVFSLLQTHMTRLRIFNLIGCVLAIIYNAPLAIWPSVGLNAALSVINIVQLIRLRRGSESKLTAAGAGRGELLSVRTAPNDPVLVALLGARRAEVEARGGRTLEQLLEETREAELKFDGDLLIGCSLRAFDSEHGSGPPEQGSGGTSLVVFARTAPQ